MGTFFLWLLYWTYYLFRLLSFSSPREPLIVRVFQLKLHLVQVKHPNEPVYITNKCSEGWWAYLCIEIYRILMTWWMWERVTYRDSKHLITLYLNFTSCPCSWNCTLTFRNRCIYYMDIHDLVFHDIDRNDKKICTKKIFLQPLIMYALL